MSVFSRTRFADRVRDTDACRCLQPKDYETAKAANLSVNGPCENDGRGCIPQNLGQLLARIYIGLLEEQQDVGHLHLSDAP